ncbi:unnamed protein product [Mesocestoides corti]|uniref:Uncharacterized protein n=1 Tax=Mesocestoides corti TaxID=53468 RepID=A0A0R3UP83_MESCO|nr:unnamed protein product [Mesocestoides corti]
MKMRSTTTDSMMTTRPTTNLTMLRTMRKMKAMR